MKGLKHTAIGLLVLTGVLIAPATGRTKITGFQFNGLEGVGDSCGLDSRIGKIADETEHGINIADCSDYSGCSIKVMWSLDRTPTSGSSYVVKMSQPGGACDETDFTTLGGTCWETLIQDEKEISTPSNLYFWVAFDDITGGECNAGTDLSTKINIVMREGSTYNYEVLTFEVDLLRPAAPELKEVTEGDQNIKVNWTDADNEDEENISYRVYWAEEPFTDTSIDLASDSDLMTGRSYQITDLENDVEYWYAVTALDYWENESLLSAVSSAMPVEVLDFFETYRASPSAGSEDGGFCFIATAAYGSYMAPDVRTLRDFRDRFLLTNAPGRLVVSAYYAVSPPLASFISDSAMLKAITRVGLWPVVKVAELTNENNYLAVVTLALVWLVAALSIGLAIARRRAS